MLACLVCCGTEAGGLSEFPVRRLCHQYRYVADCHASDKRLNASSTLVAAVVVAVGMDHSLC